jgi:hypothetical protein
MVLIPVISAIWEIEIGRIIVGSQSDKKLEKSHLIHKLLVVVHACHPSQTGSCRLDDHGLRPAPGKM